MTNFQNQFSALLDYWPHEDQSLRNLRRQAFDQFNELGFPTKRWEEWQFTDFSSMKKSGYRLSWADDLPKLPKNIPGRIPDSHLIFMINGHYQSQLLDIPKEITITTGLDHFNSNPEHYSMNKNENPFLALNTAMMNSGIPINIDPNVIIEKPIQIIYLMTDMSEQLMNHPRFIFNIGKNSQATIIEHYIGLSDQSYFVNPVSQVVIGKNGYLNHIRIQEETKSADHVATTQYILNSDSRLKTTHFSSGSKLFRHDIKLHFKGNGGEATINGLSLTENQQHHDQHVVVDHQNDACQSHQLFKYILADKSSGVFNGKVIVRENTKQTDADQSNKNLLLSPSALMNANPQLEIYTEDVKCAHGSTTGQIDKEALFYMRSRGLSKQKAIELIIGGFAKEILNPIKNEDIKTYISEKITDWLEGTVING
ncbi:MAG: Fe-S cluster assembly protein SufD [Candidatus Marinimicrobia bacterium]|jgi:Fe-S cluster assembly protein SufD|nr:Fe-S cluster assembly protein SufD [Candidatus Neomarinimicrobiota bacterium]MBT3675705.1 Fe-S cluster assembly protein SufD [Candidatus Neomarinimicrobiota bacterium]MBT3763745.1 Fe-S cluster assembly protein SufD [Candidatus Neomarinimicrobiota bacterium]MBT4067126.1 Fe-S cluster assembly protein SufD [Candidatus Neomarinimicrobiota bacterium]MBT4271044.1 Fe-S cluster assembly protein SufD [Candidatus Neomarinimicrobiota bacterium]